MKVLLGISLVGCFSAQLVHAQQAASTTAPDQRRFYVGLQLAQGEYELHYKNVLTPTVAQVASNFGVGFYLSNRLAIQAGYGRNSSYVDGVGGVQRLSSGQLKTGFFRNATADYVVPITLRYTLTKRRSHLRADFLLGLAYVHSSFDNDAHTEIDGVTVEGSHTSVNGQGEQLCATVGLSGRWVFNRHFEALADYTVNRNLEGVSGDIHQQATGNKLGLTRSISLGARYRFNLRKPAPVTAAI
ncbi:hypothetical protein GCM10027422_32440 [Hymenobacter arcticus]